MSGASGCVERLIAVTRIEPVRRPGGTPLCGLTALTGSQQVASQLGRLNAAAGDGGSGGSYQHPGVAHRRCRSILTATAKHRSAAAITIPSGPMPRNLPYSNRI